MKNLRKYLPVLFLILALPVFPYDIPNQDFVDGEILVRFRTGPFQVQEHHAVRSMGLAVLEQFMAVKNLYLLQTPPGTDMRKTM